MPAPVEGAGGSEPSAQSEQPRLPCVLLMLPTGKDIFNQAARRNPDRLWTDRRYSVGLALREGHRLGHTAAIDDFRYIFS